MAGASNYLEALILDDILNTGKVWIALFTVMPTDAGGGTEVSGGSYARVEVDSTTVDQWSVTGTTYATNINALIFPTASANWGTVVGFGIFDAVSGGNLLIFDQLLTQRIVNNGDTAEFLAGALDIYCD